MPQSLSHSLLFLAFCCFLPFFRPVLFGSLRRPLHSSPSLSVQGCRGLLFCQAWWALPRGGRGEDCGGLIHCTGKQEVQRKVCSMCAHLGNSFTHLKKSYFIYVNTQSKASMSLNPCTWWVVLTAVGTSILMPLHQYAEELFKRFAPLHRFCTKCQRSNMRVTLCNLYAFCVVSVCATMHVVSRPHT